MLIANRKSEILPHFDGFKLHLHQKDVSKSPLKTLCHDGKKQGKTTIALTALMKFSLAYSRRTMVDS